MVGDWHKVDWAKIDDWAANIPALLDEIISEDEEIRNWAYRGLNNIVFHQATVFESSVLIVPFLINLLMDDSVPDKWQILYLLHNLANAPSVDRQKPWGEQTHQAVCAGIDVYVPMLQSNYGLERRFAFQVLIRLGKDAEHVTPYLIPTLQAEMEETVKVEMVYSLGYASLSDESLKQQAVELLLSLVDTNRGKLLGALSSTSLLKILKRDAPSILVDYLVEVIRHIDQYVSKYDWWDYIGIQTEICTSLAAIDFERRVEVLIKMVKQIDDVDVPEDESFWKHLLCQELLRTAFAVHSESPLTELQKSALRAILGTTLSWEELADEDIVFRTHLPRSRGEIIRLLST